MTSPQKPSPTFDITPFLGVGLGTGLIGSAILFGNGSTASLHGWGAAVLFGGIVSNLLVQFSRSKLADAWHILRDGMAVALPSRTAIVEQFKSLARVVRRDGLLALEPLREEIDDPFLRSGIDRVLDTRREELTAGLEADRTALEERYAAAAELLDAAGSAATSFGMLASLLGVMQLLWSDGIPGSLGAGVATSLLTTLYGAVLSNMVCAPLAGKVEARRQADLSLRRLMISGLQSLAEETPPQQIERSLLAFSPPSSDRDARAA